MYPFLFVKLGGDEKWIRVNQKKSNSRETVRLIEIKINKIMSNIIKTF